MRSAWMRRASGAWFAALLLLALGCRSSQKSHPSDAGGDHSADVSTGGDLGSEGASTCVCGSTKPAVSVGACVFSIPCPPGDFFRVSIKLDGIALPRDQSRTNGWDYANADMTSIQLFGPPCQAVTNGSATNVALDYSCAGP